MIQSIDFVRKLVNSSKRGCEEIIKGTELFFSVIPDEIKSALNSSVIIDYINSKPGDIRTCLLMYKAIN